MVSDYEVFDGGNFNVEEDIFSENTISLEDEQSAGAWLRRNKTNGAAQLAKFEEEGR